MDPYFASKTARELQKEQLELVAQLRRLTPTRQEPFLPKLYVFIQSLGKQPQGQPEQQASRNPSAC